MWTFLIPGLILFSPVVEDVYRSFDRLAEAGYTNDASSLIEALHDDRVRICDDAVYYLRQMEDAGLCPELTMALEQAIKRDNYRCVSELLRLHLDFCRECTSVYDAAYHYAGEVLRGNRSKRFPESGLLMLIRLHSELNYDIFDFALKEAKEASSWMYRDLAFRILLDSYCDRVTQDDVDQIWATYPEDDGTFSLRTSLKHIRERIEHATFPCEKEEVTEEEATAEKDER